MPRAAMPHSTHAVRTGQPIAFEESGIVYNPNPTRTRTRALTRAPTLALALTLTLPCSGPNQESGIVATPIVLRPEGGLPELGSEALGWEGTARPADVPERVAAVGGEALGIEAADGEAVEGAAKRQRLLERAEEEHELDGLVLGGGGGGGGGGSTAVCWLLEMPGVPPKFDNKAADELQVPRGP